MCPWVVAISVGESSSLVGIRGLLYRFVDVMLTVMYSVTGCVDSAASPRSFARTQGISACEIMFN
jgi:hypothetical protein